MIEHGIYTTQAHAWLHLHPLEAMIYGYWTIDMLDFIAMEGLNEVDGKSKGGIVVTGKGFLIDKKKNNFVMRKRVDRVFLENIDWESLTDREAGDRYGQRVVLKLLNEYKVFPTMKRPFRLVGRKEQNLGYDVTNDGDKIEIKTELVRSRNLFVQTKEGGHRVHVTRLGEVRVTDFSGEGA